MKLMHSSTLNNIYGEEGGESSLELYVVDQPGESYGETASAWLFVFYT